MPRRVRHCMHKTFISASFATRAGFNMKGFQPSTAPAIKLGDSTETRPSAKATFWAVAPTKANDTAPPPRWQVHAWVLEALSKDILLAPVDLEKMGLFPPNWPQHNNSWGTKVSNPPRTDFPSGGSMLERE